MDTLTNHLIRSQKAARSNAKIYKQLAKETKDKKMRKVLQKLAKDDQKTAKSLKGIAGLKAKPNPLLVRVKKELYKGLNQRDLYYLTYAKRWINQKRFAKMTEAQAAVHEVKPKYKNNLAKTAMASQANLSRMKKIM